MQGKGILIAEMAPDLSYDNTQRAVEFFGNEMKIKLVANIFYGNNSRFCSFPVSKILVFISFQFSRSL